MEYKIKTPTMVWQGYDPEAEATDIKLIHTTTKDNIVIESYNYIAERVVDGCISVSLKRYFLEASDISMSKTILIIPEYNRLPSQALIFDLVRDGNVLYVVDLAGEDGTTYPESYQYGYFRLDNKHLYTIKVSAQDTCQYLYTKITRRAITVIHQLMTNCSVMLMGLGTAVEVAIQSAGVDNRVKALICYNGSGYTEYIKYNKYGDSEELEIIEERMCWLTGVASVAYAKLVTCPVLLATSTNGFNSDIDRLNNLYSLFKSGLCCIMTSVRSRDFLSHQVYYSTKLWIKAQGTQFVMPNNPSINFKITPGEAVYIEGSVDDCLQIDTATFFYSYGEYNHLVRNWLSLEAISISQQEFLAKIEVCSPQSPLFGILEVRYKNGLVLTSLEEYVNLLGQPAMVNEPKNPRVIYLPSKGEHSFTVDCKEEALFAAALSHYEVAPGIYGIISFNGSLKTYAIGANNKIPPSSTLCLDLWAKAPTEVTIKLNRLNNRKIDVFQYTLYIKEPTTTFKGYRCEAIDFKDSVFKPNLNWDNIKSITIVGDGVVVSNILFI